MFRLLSIVGIAVVMGAVVLHFAALGRKRALPPGEGEGEKIRRYNLWERLVHLALMLSFLVLAVTGFIAAFLGERLTGYLLVIHVTVAPVFAVALAAMMLTWAGDCGFAGYDWEWLKRGGGYFGGGAPPAGRFDAGEKLVLWWSAVLGLVNVLTMTLSMMPIFDQYWLTLMYEFHRYSALLLVIVMIKHSYSTLLARRGGCRMLISGCVSSEWAKRYHPLWQSPSIGRKES